MATRFSAAIFAVLLGFIGATTASAQPYVHSTKFTVQNPGGTQLDAFQVALPLDTQALVTAGEMQASGADLRVQVPCGSTVPLWIENMNTANTRIWVRLDIPAEGTELVVFWGDPNATTVSSPDAVFDAMPGMGRHSGTDTVVIPGAGGATSSQRGYRFSPNEDILLVALGRREPNGSTRYITLFDYATQAILVQTQVGGTAGEWSFGEVAPRFLTAGTQYIVELYQGPTDGYYFGTSSQASPYITYLDMRYCNSCTQDTFPTNVLSNYHYGTPDFQFLRKKTAPTAPVVIAGGSPSVDTALCDADGTPAECGDGYTNAVAGEGCDDANDDDTDACPSTCADATCGDGFVQVGIEACDDGDADDTDACPSTCANATCGDGFVLMGIEECDDANLDNADACLNACASATCGDGFVRVGVEACDDANADDTDACLATCDAATCGDGFVRAGAETCDDANADDTDACPSTCANATCGDGFVRMGMEACDDMNADDTDACLGTCVLASCGDGVTQVGVEDCDDMNADDADDCVMDCNAASCGDGFVRAGVEACDDGNAIDGDACRNSCALPSCGDGVVQVGEACDDMNTVETDACTNACMTAICGDDIVRSGVETCDDGNAVDGDGCSAACAVESPEGDAGVDDAGVDDAGVDGGGVVAGGGGCGCRTQGGRGAMPNAAGLLGLALVAVLGVRRRRRG